MMLKYFSYDGSNKMGGVKVKMVPPFHFSVDEIGVVITVNLNNTL